jgi:hypothetical protein
MCVGIPSRTGIRNPLYIEPSRFGSQPVDEFRLPDVCRQRSKLLVGGETAATRDGPQRTLLEQPGQGMGGAGGTALFRVTKHASGQPHSCRQGARPSPPMAPSLRPPKFLHTHLVSPVRLAPLTPLTAAVPGVVPCTAGSKRGGRVRSRKLTIFSAWLLASVLTDVPSGAPRLDAHPLTHLQHADQLGQQLRAQPRATARVHQGHATRRGFLWGVGKVQPTAIRGAPRAPSLTSGGPLDNALEPQQLQFVWRSNPCPSPTCVSSLVSPSSAVKLPCSFPNRASSASMGASRQ